MPAHSNVEENGLAVMWRSAGVAPEVNLREHITCTPLSTTNKAAHFGFETQGRRHQKSKTWVSVAPQKGFMSSKYLKKRTSQHRSTFMCESNGEVNY